MDPYTPNNEHRKETVFPPLSKSTGVNRFRKAAISVLSKVVEAKTEEEEFTDDEASPSSDNVSESVYSIPMNTQTDKPLISSKSRSQSLSKLLSSTRKSSEDITAKTNITKARRLTLPSLNDITNDTRNVTAPKRRQSKSRTPSLASIVGLMTFRKLYMAKVKKDEERLRRASSLESTVPETTPSPCPPRISQKRIQTPYLPSIPRFAATLSSEAQFAMLKGYEDVVLDRLENSFPTKSDYNWHELRTKTPGVSLKESPDEDDESDDRRSSGTVRSPLHGSGVPGRARGPEASRRSTHRKAGKQGWKKQLRITYRLEYAMDMLDTINEELGEVSISPRRRKMTRNVDPVENCEDWIYGWNQEFVTTSNH